MATQYQTELIIGGENTDAKTAVNEVRLLLDGLGRTYKNVSLAGTEGANQTAAAYERLRKQIDPLYAHSKRYEAAVRDLTAARKAGIITESQYETQLEQTAHAMGFLDAAQENLNNNMRLSRFHTANVAAQLNDIFVMMAAGQSPMMTGIQQGSQLNQIWASMGVRGGNLTGILKAVGIGFASLVTPASLLTIGVIAAGSALGQLVLSMTRADETMTELEEHSSGLEDKTKELADEVFRLASGYETLSEAKVAGRIAELTQEILSLEQQIRDTAVEGGEALEMQRLKLVDQREELQGILDSYEQQRQTKEDMIRLEEAFVKKIELALERAKEMEQVRIDRIINLATVALERAVEEQRKLADFTKSVEQALDNAAKEADAMAEEIYKAYINGDLLSKLDIAGGIYSAADAAGVLAEKLGVSLSIAQGIVNLTARGGGDPRLGAMIETGLVPEVAGPGGGLPGAPEATLSDVDLFPGGSIGGGRRKGGGGGGGKEDPLIAELERLQEFLQTEIEMELEAFEERQRILEEALEKRMITQEEYNEMMERLQEEHNSRMADLDVYRYGSALAQAETFFGDMADALRNGNEEMQRIGKIFAAAEALVNAWRAYSQVLADPSLPWWAKIPKALAVLSAGIGAVNAIKGVGKGGTGPTSPGAVGDAGSIAPGGPPTQSQAISVTLIGENFSRAQVLQLVEAVNNARDDGLSLRGVR